jgi:DNA repair protein RadD
MAQRGFDIVDVVAYLDSVAIWCWSPFPEDELRRLQIASVQTLHRRDLPQADVVVVDEAHRWHTFYGKWFTDPAWLGKPIIGLSATPWTKGLGRWYDDLIIAATTAELIAAGYLSPFRFFAPAHPDLTGVRTVMGDYHEGDLGEGTKARCAHSDVLERCGIVHVPSRMRPRPPRRKR